MITHFSGRLGIAGVGTAVPEHRMTQEQATELADAVIADAGIDGRATRIVYRRAGVKTRYTSIPHHTAIDWLDADIAAGVMPRVGPTTRLRMQHFQECAPALALQAAQKALVASETQPAEITHLVTVTCTGFTAPGVDIAVIRDLELRPTVERVQVGFMGCHGAINGLRVAQGLVAAQPTARVLLCAVELCSLHYTFDGDPARFVGNTIFGDGAGAMVLQAVDDARPWRLLATGSCLLPNSTDAMQWLVGDHGFEMLLSPRIPDLILHHLRGWLEPWLAEHGVALEGVASWAVHPGGPRILSAVEESLGLTTQATAVSRSVLSDFGNMSSPTVLFVLDRLRQADAPRPCVALGFGPGLMAEAAIFV